uniref:Hyaluronidase n=1 Tax=Kryptolebias marmoratus TaxID=37003 RepID=A0A3Q2ZYS7_KRYMA
MLVVPVGGASSSHHIVPVAFTCSWLFLFFQATFAQKPAKLPLISRKPFIAAWNAPLDMCTIKYNITTNLGHLFHIQGSPRADWTGQNVTIFYANRLGYYPYYTPQGSAIHGGLPQNCSLDRHLLKAYQDIIHFIPAEDFHGLAVIDWEFWRPQWDRNWHKKDIYRRKSKELTIKAYVNMTAAQVEALARRRFEKSAKAFMQRTIQLGTYLRPSVLWGFYLYPDCHNYNLHEKNYTGLCPLLEKLRNDELLWLWNSSTALFPSVAIRKSHTNSISNLHFAQHRIRESLRIASLTSTEYDLPTYVYLRLGYRDDALAFLTTKDLIHTIGESAALGAAGFVIWGDLNLTSSRTDLVNTVGESAALGASGVVMWGGTKDYNNKAACQSLSEYLTSTFNPYIANVTAAAMLCSEVLCQGNGRCVRKDYDSSNYLHLNPASFDILRAGEKYVAVGLPSASDLNAWSENFTCQCYAGWQCSPRLQKPTRIKVISV